ARGRRGDDDPDLVVDGQRAARPRCRACRGDDRRLRRAVHPVSGAGRGAVDPFDDPGPSPRRGRGGRLPRRRDVPNTRPLPEWVKRLAWVLDDAFEVPGLPGRRVGVDGLIALVPVVGDAAGIVVAVVIVVAGVAAGVSLPTVLRMMLHVGVEAVVGLVPVLGA